MTVLGAYLQHVHSQARNRNAVVPLGEKFFNWRRNDLTQARRENVKPSLALLLYHFVGCGCQIKRDRVFALLPLAHPRPRIEIDYDVDSEVLFRRILGLHMDDCSIEDLMACGATLVEPWGYAGPSLTTRTSAQLWKVAPQDRSSETWFSNARLKCQSHHLHGARPRSEWNCPSGRLRVDAVFGSNSSPQAFLCASSTQGIHTYWNTWSKSQIPLSQSCISVLMSTCKGLQKYVPTAREQIRVDLRAQ